MPRIAVECFGTLRRIWYVSKILIRSRNFSSWSLSTQFQCLGKSIPQTDPSTVRTLSEKLWAHCHFTGQYTLRQPDDSEAAEYAARIAVQLGDPSDVWLLDQARNPEVGPRTLWALIDQRMSTVTRVIGPKEDYDAMITAELRRITSGRLGAVKRSVLSELYYLAQIWILLGAFDEAERTAMDILSLQEPGHLERTYHILTLRLLAFAASGGRAVGLADVITALYNQLWSGYTPAEESSDRQEIDDLLK